MAVVDTGTNNPNDPNNPNNLPGNVNQPGAGGNQPATTGGAGGVTPTGAGNVTGQVTGTANPSQPFQNIASYLAANAPQSKELANQVAGTVSAPINEAQQGITKAADTFTQSVNTGYTPENKDLNAAVAANPAGVVAENPENATNFLANLKDIYTGPTDFAQAPGYADLQAKIAAARGAAANTENESGIQSLLGKVEGPTTAGINKLDSLLLSANPENYQTIKAAGTGAADLSPTLNTTTAQENALAAAGTTNASTAAQHAAAALQAALAGETGNLTNEQNTIEGIVNAYNKSVGTINPVTQTIAQDIQDFLAANPQLSLPDAASALAPLTNLQTLAMPQESTYASPEDYATIAALAKLGLDPSVLAGLPIGGATANLAQTFDVPTTLQDAIGQAPGVESALNTELNTLGGQINTAVSPFTNSQTASNNAVSQAMSIMGTKDPGDVGGWSPTSDRPLFDPSSGASVPKMIPQTVTGPRGQKSTTSVPNPAWKALADQIMSLKTTATNSQATMRSAAPGLQWVNTAAPGYNDLIAAINAQLGKLGSVGVPNLTYGPNTVTNPVTGAPIGVPVGKEAGKAAALGIGAGVPAAAGISAGLAEAGGAAAAAGDVAAETGATLGGEGLATSGAPAIEAATNAAPISTGLTGAGQIAGPAALAAYGTSNVIQNSLKNPITAGLSTLANTGLSLATLSLPPQVFESIGKDIKNVLSDIGNFFGGLF